MATTADRRDGQGRRVDDRQDVAMDATLRAYRVPPVPAALIDISSGGAMLKMDGADLQKGDEVVLDTAGRQIVATIAWSSEQVFGLAFHRRLDEREMSWLKRVGRA
jgi:hypothetical protein